MRETTAEKAVNGQPELDLGIPRVRDVSSSAVVDPVDLSPIHGYERPAILSSASADWAANAPWSDAGRLILNPGKIVAKPRCIAVIQIGQPMPQETPVRRQAKASKSSTLSANSNNQPALHGVQAQRWLTARQATDRLGVCASTFERMIRKQVIPLYRVGPGGPRRFRIEDVDRAMIPEHDPDSRADTAAFISNTIKEG